VRCTFGSNLFAYFEALSVLSGTSRLLLIVVVTQATMVKTAKPVAGQRSLFSFFKKKKTAATPPPQPKSSSIKPTAGSGSKHTPVEKSIAVDSHVVAPKVDLFANEKALQKKKSLANTKPTSSPRTPSPKKTRADSRPSSKKPAVATFNGTAEEMVGLRMKIFWPHDNEWYAGQVADYNARDDLHLFQYDDGEEDWLDFDEEKYQIIGGSQKRKSASLKSTVSRKQARRKRIVDDDSSEEEEYNPDEEQDAAAESSDDDALDLCDDDEDEEPYSPEKKPRSRAKPKPKKTPPPSKSTGSPFLARHRPRATAGRKAKASSISGSPTAAASAVTNAAAAAGESAPGVLKMGAHAHNKYSWLNENR